MKTATIFASVLISVCFSTSWATIINVPDDYSTIQEGIDASFDGDTVLVQPDIYLENINFNGHNTVLGSLFLTTGDTAFIAQTIIDGNSAGSVVRFENGEDSSAVITGFTIRNGLSEAGAGIYCTGASPIICYNRILNNNTAWFGGGLYCEAASFPLIEKNIFSGNSADWGGGGLYIDGSRPRMEQNVVFGNSTEAFGGGILCVNNANVDIINCVLSRNRAGFGGGICCEFTSYPALLNTILWADSASLLGQEVFSDDASEPAFAYCDIQNTYRPGDGNIDEDPLFRDPENGDFHLMSSLCGDPDDSPCIDAGHPEISDSLLDCSWGLVDLRSDMGAYGGGDSVTVGIADQGPILPGRFAMMQNYPNPFNASTVIRYSLPAASDVTIEIYDLLGRRVETLVRQSQPAGYHQVSWDATGRSSGVYFCRVRAGAYTSTGTMVLLK